MATALPDSIISHWNTMIENHQISPLEFYGLVEEAIKKRKIPDIKAWRMKMWEGGMLFAEREYLRVKRNEHSFDICGAPFGNGFFVSWWLGESRSGFVEFILKIPLIGPVCRALFCPTTYYKIDTAMMFQTAVHSAVLEVLDEMTKAKGLRGIPELERKPIMREFYRG